MTQEVPMLSDGAPPSTPSFGERMRIAFMTFLRALVRLIVFVILVALVVWGTSVIYRLYLVPIQDSIVRVEDEQALQKQNNQQYEQRLDELQKRARDLEVQNDTDKQTLDELRTHLEDTQSTQQAYLEILESTQTATTASLDEIDASLDGLDKKLVTLDAALEQVGADIEGLDDQVKALDYRINDQESPVAALRREIQLLKAMELLTRSRVFIVENNLGLAKDDIETARSLLVILQVPAHQAEAKAAIVERLDLAISNLPDSPVLAAEDLEVAWQLLKRGLPGELPLPSNTETETAEITPPQEGTALTTPSPTPTSAGESTPTSTPTPTATP